MSSISEFFSVFLTTDYFLILLIILLLILLVITIHLIKVENYYKRNKNSIESDDDILDQNESNLVLNFGNEEDISDKNIVFEDNSGLNDKFGNIEKIFNDDNELKLESYEKDEEESAIISTEELESLSKEKCFELNNKTLINQYEEEQEKKAIISYEELLKNASSLKVSYKEEPIDINGPIVRKIEIEKPNIERNLNYIEETNFLSTLKDFRANLK